MQEYEVITDFVDLSDGNFVYRSGDLYPRSGANPPTKARIQQLTSADNALKTEIIRERVVDEKPVKKTGRKRNA